MDDRLEIARENAEHAGDMEQVAAAFETAAKMQREHIGITYEHGWKLLDLVCAHGTEIAAAIRRR